MTQPASNYFMHSDGYEKQFYSTLHSYESPVKGQSLLNTQPYTALYVWHTAQSSHLFFIVYIFTSLRPMIAPADP